MPWWMAPMRHRSYTITQTEGPRHAVALSGLQALCFPEDTPLPTDEGYWWLVTACGQPVAFACLTEAESIPLTGLLARGGVLPDHRGQGLQTVLIKVRERLARSLGWLALISTTYENAPSGNNLMKAGFRLYQPEDPWMSEGTNYWRKVIA